MMLIIIMQKGTIFVELNWHIDMNYWQSDIVLFNIDMRSRIFI